MTRLPYSILTLAFVLAACGGIPSEQLEKARNGASLQELGLADKQWDKNEMKLAAVTTNEQLERASIAIIPFAHDKDQGKRVLLDGRNEVTGMLSSLSKNWGNQTNPYSHRYSSCYGATLFLGQMMVWGSTLNPQDGSNILQDYREQKDKCAALAAE
ncbi:hypothetical protein [Neisseria sp. P0017.S007]|jgi:lipoprotein|uniref:hypothetical protein n=1 Tax=unclassified Neisseria TaxID=2623750 RepID=UPI003F7F3571